jgi:hypothetical protein
MSAVQLDYGAKDVMKLQISFQYRYWRNKDYAKTAAAQTASAIQPQNPLRASPVIIPQVTANVSPSSQARLSSESEYVREMRARGLDPADPDGSLRLGIRGNTI